MFGFIKHNSFLLDLCFLPVTFTGCTGPRFSRAERGKDECTKLFLFFQPSSQNSPFGMRLEEGHRSSKEGNCW